MKFGNFWIKLVSLILIAGCLFYYQSVAVSRAEMVEENNRQVLEIERNNREVRAMMEGAEAKGPYKDGTYEGTAEGYGGPIRVSVVIAGGYIDQIDVTEHSKEDPAYYMLAESVLDRILDLQNTETDTVSGATFSSGGLLRAVSDALSEAGNE